MTRFVLLSEQGLLDALAVMLHDVELTVDGKLMIRRGEDERSGTGKIKGGEILGAQRGREGATAASCNNLGGQLVGRWQEKQGKEQSLPL